MFQARLPPVDGCVAWTRGRWGLMCSSVKEDQEAALMASGIEAVYPPINATKGSQVVSGVACPCSDTTGWVTVQAPGAAVIDGLKCMLSQFWRLEAQIKVSAGLCSRSRLWGGNPFLPLSSF